MVLGGGACFRCTEEIHSDYERGVLRGCGASRRTSAERVVIVYVRQSETAQSAHSRPSDSGRIVETPGCSPALERAGIAAFVTFCLLAVDAAIRFPGRLDLAVMKVAQRVDHPELGPKLNEFERLTDSSGAVMAWAATLIMFAMRRWWVPVLGCLAIPLGGLVNEMVSRVLVQRTRPHLDELRHVSDNFEERSFPSGHVVGAVLLYGYIWYVVGERVENRPIVWTIRSIAAIVIALTGFDRVWSGAHWPSDVGGGCALGFALLAALIIASDRIGRIVGGDGAASRGESLLS